VTHGFARLADPTLEHALVRLDLTLALAQREGELAIDADGSPPDGSPEAGLLQSLGQTTAALSFSTDDTAEADGAALLDELLARSRTAVQVETRRAERVVAATTIEIDGDARSVLAPRATADELARHREAVAAAIEARAARLRTLAAVVSAATRIAIASGTGNPLLVLRAAVRFMSDVLSEHARTSGELS
jgi:hypothetical protein